ncbi:flagellar hook assembly protein FlgD, partial [Herbiconiux ginsengi]|uniref:carbohydrate binding domain-containing protein n=1 Tax=Herbiconiux ginsengi TaxID=381665 RepID=UPI001C317A41
MAAAASIAMTAGLLTALVAEPASADEISPPVENFEASPTTWAVSAGSAVVAQSPDASEGARSLSLAYDVSGGQAEIQPVSSLVVPSGLYSALKLDLKGDGTWNTVYLTMTDSTGEVFIYRVDSINVTTWKTVTVDLTKAPVSSAGGNADKVLDGPIALTKIYLTRNGSQPPTGTVLLDNIRVVGDGWSVPASSRSYFTPSNGESTSFTFSAGSVGDYALQLKDSSGRVRVLSGTVSAAGTQSVDWDGKDAGGSQLLGVVNAVLSYDSVPDGVLAAQPVSGGVVGITTVAEPVGAAALLLDFEDSGASWKKTAGSVTLGGSTSRTQGATSLSLAYDVSGGPAEIRPVATPISAPMNAFSALKVDLKGDGTWNTVYLNVTDATGEVFNYRVDSMNVTTWKTVSVDLTVAPSTTSGGNADKVLDAPIAVTKIYLTRNGTQPATGTIFLDNIRAVGDGWTSPTS